MFQGLRTVIYMVDDIAAAKTWYNTLLGFGPYFDEPFYVGYDVGGYELGLHPRPEGQISGQSPVSYWGVPSIEAAFKRMQAAGAKVHDEIQDVGGDIKVACLLDPFGNLIGIIENPHFGKNTSTH